MKKLFLLLACIAMLSITQTLALTLEGGVEKTDVMKKMHWWQRLFAPEPEGRIGVRIGSSGNIAYVHPGSPADKIGLLKGDRVLVVDGRKHAIDDISGEPGTTVHLSVERRSDQFAVDIERVDFRQIAK